MPFNKDVFGPLTIELTLRVEQIAREVGADAAAMWLYDVLSEEFGVPIGWNLIHPDSFADERTRPLRDGFSARVMLRGEIRPVSDLPENQRLNVPFVLREHICSYTALPLVHGDIPVGILFLNFRRHTEFPPQLLNRYVSHGKDLASEIALSGVFSSEEPAEAPILLQQQDVLDALVRTIAGTLRRPVVVWLFEPLRERRYLKVSAGTGVRSAYLDLTLDVTADRSVVTEVVRTGKSRLVHDISAEPNMKFEEFFQSDGWKSAAYCPIFSRGQCVGTFEVFYTDCLPDRDVDFATLERLAMIATVSIQNFERMRESQRIREIAQVISAKPDIRNALTSIAECARDLTAADSASILLYAKKGDRFEFETHSPKEASFGAWRSDLDELARRVIQSGEEFINAGPDSIPGELALSPRYYRSFIGIRVPLEDDLVGMFGVFSRQISQFSEHDANLLHLLAGQVSVALGWVQRLLRPTIAVDSATAGLARQNEELTRLSDGVIALGYDYVAVQMVRPDERTVKTDLISEVDGHDIKTNWSGPYGHYLSSEPSLRDIQADIVLKAENRTEASIEVISGWDPRFDAWNYEKHGHEGLTRVVVPILIVRDEYNRVVSNWMTHGEWNSAPPILSWKPRRVQGNSSSQIPPDGFCITYQKLLPLAELKRWRFEVLGTVEAGYQNPDKQITQSDVEKITAVAVRHSLDIRKTGVMYVFETILQCARQIVSADAATLQFNYTPASKSGIAGYQYECYDGLDWSVFHTPPIRAEGIGQKAIKAKKPLFCPDLSSGHGEDDYKRDHRRMYSVGFRSTGAFPFYVDGRSGVLYLHFKHLHRIAPDEEEWIKLFVNKAADAIRHAISYTRMRDTENQLRTLNSVFQSLVRNPESRPLVSEIAWNTLNMLAADLVTIYEYQRANNDALSAPIRAGRMIEREDIGASVTNEIVPVRIIESGEDIYCANSRIHPLLGTVKRTDHTTRPSYVEREKILSSCAVLLRAGDETVGVMFVNYRRPHIFSKEEKDLLSMLASSAAIAIQNRRALQVLVDVGKNVIQTPDLTQLLSLILALSIKATRADLAEVWLADYATDEMECRCFCTRPVINAFGQRVRRVPFGHKVVGRINQLSQTGHRPMPIDIPNTVATNSETSLESARTVLTLPLFDSDGQVIGVINLESCTAGAFSEIDHTILDALADHAIIAINNDKSQRKANANAVLADLGFAGPSFHRSNNHAILIRDDAEEIAESNVDSLTKRKAESIATNARRIMDEATKLQHFISIAIPSAVDLRSTLKSVLDQCEKPATVRLQHDPPNELPAILGTEYVLTHVFLDLVKNAIDAMPDGGDLTISYKTVGTKSPTDGVLYAVVVTVADTGAGIPEEMKERIFERGFTQKGNPGHMGFGLWWARLRLQGMGGDITVQSTPGRGAAFNVILPTTTQ